MVGKRNAFAFLKEELNSSFRPLTATANRCHKPQS